MTSDLDKAYLHYTTNPNRLDALLEAVRRYAERIASREGSYSPEDAGQEIAIRVWRALSTFQRQSSFRTWVHTVVTNHLLAEARARKSRITLQPVEELPERSDPDPGFDRFPLDRFDEDERHLLTTFARSLNFDQAAQDLGISAKALRSRLERIKARELTGLGKPAGYTGITILARSF